MSYATRLALWASLFLIASKAYPCNTPYPPYFTPSTSINRNYATVGLAYADTLAGTALDPDGTPGPVTYTATVNPSNPGTAWLTVSPNGEMTGIPTTANVGTHTWTVSASDGANASEQDATLTIVVQRAPYFTSSPVTAPAASVGVAYSQTISSSATDPDGDTLIFTKASGPTWLQVASNGGLSGTPGVSDLGANEWQVRVEDGRGGSDLEMLQITVNQDVDNTAPTFGGLVSAIPDSSGDPSKQDDVTLSWATATDDITPFESIAYKIFMSTGSSIDTINDTPFATVGAAALEVTGSLLCYTVEIPDISASTRWAVCAVDASSNQSLPITERIVYGTGDFDPSWYDGDNDWEAVVDLDFYSTFVGSGTPSTMFITGNDFVQVAGLTHEWVTYSVEVDLTFAVTGNSNKVCFVQIADNNDNYSVMVACSTTYSEPSVVVGVDLVKTSDQSSLAPLSALGSGESLSLTLKGIDQFGSLCGVNGNNFSYDQTGQPENGTAISVTKASSSFTVSGNDVGSAELRVSGAVDGLPLEVSKSFLVEAGVLDRIEIDPPGPVRVASRDRLSFAATGFDANDNVSNSDIQWQGGVTGWINADGLLRATSTDDLIAGSIRAWSKDYPSVYADALVTVDGRAPIISGAVFSPGVDGGGVLQNVTQTLTIQIPVASPDWEEAVPAVYDVYIDGRLLGSLRQEAAASALSTLAFEPTHWRSGSHELKVVSTDSVGNSNADAPFVAQFTTANGAEPATGVDWLLIYQNLSPSAHSERGCWIQNGRNPSEWSTPGPYPLEVVAASIQETAAAVITLLDYDFDYASSENNSTKQPAAPVTVRESLEAGLSYLYTCLARGIVEDPVSRLMGAEALLAAGDCGLEVRLIDYDTGIESPIGDPAPLVLQIVDAEIARDSDGGFALTGEKGSSRLATLMALRLAVGLGDDTLVEMYRADDGQSVLGYIAERYQSDLSLQSVGSSGWALNQWDAWNVGRSVFISAEMLRTLVLLERENGSSDSLDTLTNDAASFLMDRDVAVAAGQLGFGDTPDGVVAVTPTVVDTAVSVLALWESGDITETQRNEAAAYLSDQQDDTTHSWNERAFDTALALRTLRPDLVIQSVGNRSFTAATGLYSYPITIKNVGVAAAAGFVVGAHYDDPEGLSVPERDESRVAASDWIATLGIGSETTVNVPIAGARTPIYFMVDDSNCVPEAVESNNAMAYGADARPDMTVTPGGILFGHYNTGTSTFTEGPVVEGEDWAIQVTATNIGATAIAADVVTLSVLLGDVSTDPSGCTTLQSDLADHILSPGESHSFVLSLTGGASPFSLPKTYFISATVTATGLDEVTEANNQAVTTVRILPSSPPDGVPDLAIADASFVEVSPERPAPGTAFSVRALVENLGNAPAIDPVVEMSVDGAYWLRHTFSGSVDAGGSYYAEFSPVLEAPGGDLTIVVDPNDWIAELSETNNTVIKGVAVLAADSTWDLAVGCSNEDIRPVYDGSSWSLEVTVHNLSSNHNYDPSVDGGSVLTAWHESAVGGPVVIGSVVLTEVITASGERTIVFPNAPLTVDADKQPNVVKVELTNNTDASAYNDIAYSNLHVQGPIVAGDNLSAGVLTANPPTGAVTDPFASTLPVEFSIEVTNSFNTTVSDVGLQLRLEPAGEVLWSGEMDSIAGNTIAQIVIADVPVPIGDHQIALIVDPANRVLESNEDDNCSYASVSIIDAVTRALPDLTFGSPPITVSYASGDPVIAVTLVNVSADGSIPQDAAGFTIALYEESDSPPPQVGSVNVSGLAGGASITVVVPFDGGHSPDMSSNDHTVVIDDLLAVSETNENNNSYCLSSHDEPYIEFGDTYAGSDKAWLTWSEAEFGLASASDYFGYRITRLRAGVMERSVLLPMGANAGSDYLLEDSGLTPGVAYDYTLSLPPKSNAPAASDAVSVTTITPPVIEVYHDSTSLSSGQVVSASETSNYTVKASKGDELSADLYVNGVKQAMADVSGEWSYSGQFAPGGNSFVAQRDVLTDVYYNSGFVTVYGPGPLSEPFTVTYRHGVDLHWIPTQTSIEAYVSSTWTTKDADSIDDLDVGTPLRIRGKISNQGQIDASSFKVNFEFQGSGSYVQSDEITVAGLGYGESVDVLSNSFGAFEVPYDSHFQRFILTLDSDDDVIELHESNNELRIEACSTYEPGLKMQMYDFPATGYTAWDAITNLFSGYTPDDFEMVTASGSSGMVSSVYVGQINFPESGFQSDAFYNVGPDNQVETGSDYDAPLGDDYSAQPPGGPETFGAKFEGYIYLPTGGNVTFTVGYDDSYVLYVDDTLVGQEIGLSDYAEESTTVQGLPSGFVPIEVYFEQGPTEACLVLEASGGGLPPGVVPEEYLYHSVIDCADRDTEVDLVAEFQDSELSGGVWDDGFPAGTPEAGETRPVAGIVSNRGRSAGTDVEYRFLLDVNGTETPITDGSGGWDVDGWKSIGNLAVNADALVEVEWTNTYYPSVNSVTVILEVRSDAADGETELSNNSVSVVVDNKVDTTYPNLEWDSAVLVNGQSYSGTAVEVRWETDTSLDVTRFITCENEPLAETEVDADGVIQTVLLRGTGVDLTEYTFQVTQNLDNVSATQTSYALEVDPNDNTLESDETDNQVAGTVDVTYLFHDVKVENLTVVGETDGVVELQADVTRLSTAGTYPFQSVTLSLFDGDWSTGAAGELVDQRTRLVWEDGDADVKTVSFYWVADGRESVTVSVVADPFDADLSEHPTTGRGNNYTLLTMENPVERNLVVQTLEAQVDSVAVTSVEQGRDADLKSMIQFDAGALVTDAHTYLVRFWDGHPLDPASSVVGDEIVIDHAADTAQILTESWNTSALHGTRTLYAEADRREHIAAAAPTASRAPIRAYNVWDGPGIIPNIASSDGSEDPWRVIVSVAPDADPTNPVEIGRWESSTGDITLTQSASVGSVLVTFETIDPVDDLPPFAIGDHITLWMLTNAPGAGPVAAMVDVVLPVTPNTAPQQAFALWVASDGSTYFTSSLSMWDDYNYHDTIASGIAIDLTAQNAMNDATGRVEETNEGDNLTLTQVSISEPAGFDISVDSVTVPTGSYSPGDIIALDVTVTNHDAPHSRSFALNVFAGADLVVTPVTTAHVNGDWALGESRVVTVPLSSLGFSGTVPLRATAALVDDDATNNSSDASVVMTGQATLTISAPTPSPAGPNTAVSFDVQVSFSPAMTATTALRVVDDGGGTVDTLTVAALQSQSVSTTVETVPVQWNTGLVSPGTYRISGEMTEDSTGAVRATAVSPTVEISADVGLAVEVTTDRSFYNEGETPRLRVVVANDGLSGALTGSTAISVTVDRDDGVREASYSETVTDLDPGASVSFDYMLSGLSEQSYDAQVTATNATASLTDTDVEFFAVGGAGRLPGEKLIIEPGSGLTGSLSPTLSLLSVGDHVMGTSDYMWITNERRPMSHRNLLFNGLFDIPGVQGSGYAGWYGSRILSDTATELSNSPLPTPTSDRSDSVRVSAGEHYCLSAQVNGLVSADPAYLTARVIQYDASGEVCATDITATVTKSSLGSWGGTVYLLEQPFMTSYATRFVDVVFTYSQNGAQSGSISLNDVKLTPGTVAPVTVYYDDNFGDDLEITRTNLIENSGFVVDSGVDFTRLRHMLSTSMDSTANNTIPDGWESEGAGTISFGSSNPTDLQARGLNSNVVLTPSGASLKLKQHYIVIPLGEEFTFSCWAKGTGSIKIESCGYDFQPDPTYDCDVTVSAGAWSEYIGYPTVDSGVHYLKVTIDATDSQSPLSVAGLKLCSDHTSVDNDWSGWTLYDSSLTWPLLSGSEGQRAAHVRYLTRLGNVSHGRLVSLTSDTDQTEATAYHYEEMVDYPGEYDLFESAIQITEGFDGSLDSSTGDAIPLDTELFSWTCDLGELAYVDSLRFATSEWDFEEVSISSSVDGQTWKTAYYDEQSRGGYSDLLLPIRQVSRYWRVEVTSSNYSGGSETYQQLHILELRGALSPLGDDTAIVDLTPPSIGFTQTPVSPTNKESINVDVSAVDALSGVVSIEYKVHGVATVAWTSLPDIIAGQTVNGSFSVDSSTEGDYTITIRCTDAAGHTSTEKAKTITVSRTPPTVDLHTYTPDPTRYSGITVTIDASGGTGGVASVKVCSNFDSSEPDWDLAVYDQGEGHYTASVTLNNEGVNTITARATDAAGNVADDEDEVTLDTIAPRCEIMAPLDDSQHKVAVAMTWQSSDSDVESYTALCDYTPYTGSGALSDVSVSLGDDAPDDITGAGDGTYVLTVYATDEAGNDGQSDIHTFEIDETAPTIALTEYATDPTNTPYITVSGTASDAGVGLAKVEARVGTSGDWTEATINGSAFSVKLDLGTVDGVKTVYAKATDILGNESSEDSDSIELDTEGPVTTISSPDDGSYHNSTVTLDWDSTDSNATYSASYVRTPFGGSAGSPQSVSAEDTVQSDGEYVLTVAATDQAQNTGPTATCSFTIDSTNPTLSLTAYTPDPSDSRSITFSGTASDGQTHVTDVEWSIDDGVTWNAANYDSSAETFSASVTFASDGQKTVKARSKDAAGNHSAIASDTVTIDTTPPSITVTAPSAGTVSGDISLDIDVSDTLSGVDTATWRVDLAGEGDGAFSGRTDDAGVSNFTYTLDTELYMDGSTYIVFTATDLAGNQANASVAIVIDNDLPPAAPNGLQASYESLTTVRVTWASPVEGDFSHHKLYRKDASDAGDIDETDLLDGNVTTIDYYLDTAAGSASGPVVWLYALKAVDLAGNISGFSDPVTPTLPDVPSLRAAAGDGFVSLDWDRVYDSLSKYVIWRGVYVEGVATSFLPIYTEINGAVMTYVDQNVVNGVVYQYYVVPYDGRNQGGKSNTVMAAPVSSGGSQGVERQQVWVKWEDRLESGKKANWDFDDIGVQMNAELHWEERADGIPCVRKVCLADATVWRKNSSADWHMFMAISDLVGSATYNVEVFTKNHRLVRSATSVAYDPAKGIPLFIDITDGASKGDKDGYYLTLEIQLASWESNPLKPFDQAPFDTWIEAERKRQPKKVHHIFDPLTKENEESRVFISGDSPLSGCFVPTGIVARGVGIETDNKKDLWVRYERFVDYVKSHGLPLVYDDWYNY